MKTILAVLILLFSVNLIKAQAAVTTTLSPANVPESVKTTFKTEFPTVQPKWEADGKNYKAVYADPKTNSKGIITYDAEGKAINRDTEVITAKPE